VGKREAGPSRTSAVGTAARIYRFPCDGALPRRVALCAKRDSPGRLQGSLSHPWGSGTLLAGGRRSCTSSWLLHKAVSENELLGRGDGRQGGRVPRRQDGRASRDGYVGRFRNPPLEAIQRARRGFVQQPPMRAILSPTLCGFRIQRRGGSSGRARSPPHGHPSGAVLLRRTSRGICGLMATRSAMGTPAVTPHADRRRERSRFHCARWTSGR
jgi:hypothetical protein